MICHIVLFEPKASLTDADKRLFAQSVLDVCRRIESVSRFSLGRSVAIDCGYERNFGDQTYQYSAILEFDDVGGLKKYLNDPAHAELGRLFWTNCERAVVCETRTVDPAGQSAVDDLVL